MKIKTRRYYIYYAARILFFFICLIPRGLSLVIADFLGKSAFNLLRKYRYKTIANLNEVFSRDRERNISIARDVFRNLAKNGADWIKMAALDKKGVKKLVTEISGLEHLDNALEGGKGAILMASHFGNWELLSVYLHSIGYSGAIMARRIYFHKYDRMIVNLRKRFGANVVYRDESPKQFFRVLKRGEILGMLADQDVDDVDGVFVDFFGKPAYTPTAPVRFGMAAGASLVPAFMIRKPDNTYKLIIENAISPVPGDDKEADIKKYTLAWTKVLEKYVKQYPDQWVWLHSRWKTKSE